MRGKLILIAAAGALVGTLALAPPAEAGHLDWSVGVGFHVGGAHFRIGFAPPGFGGYPGPFFLTTGRLHHPGYGCNGACFRRGASYYHHASCPLLRFHLGRVGYGPDHYLRSYSPYRGFGYYSGPLYRPYNRSYGFYYRDRFRSHPHRGRHYDDWRYRGHRSDPRYRYDQRRGHDYDHDSDSDSDRHYRGDRGSRGRVGGREYAQPRRGARVTRPPH